MKRGLLIVVLILISLLSTESDAVDISTCQALSSSTNYDLTSDVYAALDSNCFSGGSNSVLDCNGYTIFGNTSNTAPNKWGYAATVSDITIQNCIFEDWSASNNWALFGSGANLAMHNITVRSNSQKIALFTGVDGTVFNNVTFEGTSYLQVYGSASGLTLNNIEGRLSLESTVGDIRVENWTYTGSTAITFQGEDVYLSGLNFTDSTGKLTLKPNNMTINNSYFTGQSQGLEFWGNNTNLVNTEYVNSTGRIYYLPDAHDINIDNLTMINVTGSVFSLGFDSPKNLTVVNSKFRDIDKFYAYHVSGDGDSYNFNISNNEFNSTVYNDFDIEIWDNYNANINNNVFFNLLMDSEHYNSTYDGNNLYNVSITLKGANNTNFSNNNLYTSYLKTGHNVTEKTYNVNIFNNYLEEDLLNNAMDVYFTEDFNVFNNTCNATYYCISVSKNTSDGFIYDNTGNSTVAAAHGIMLTGNSTNVTVHGNTMEDMDFGFLFEWGAFNNTMYNNTMKGGIFYSLHDTYNNTAYNNTIIGDLILHDNVMGENFYSNNVTGDLIFRWDLVLGPEGTGAFNNTIQDTTVGGNLHLSGNSTGNTLINVTFDGTEFVDSENISSYSRKWYLDIATGVLNTNITIKNSTDGVIYSDLTNDSIPRQTLLDYINTGGTKTNYSNYTITAQASGYQTNTTLINLTENKNINFSLTATPTATEDTSSSGSNSYSVRDNSVEEGFERTMSENQRLEFDINNEKHELKIENIYRERKIVEVSVSSEKQSKNMTEGEEWKVDIDLDGKTYDLLVKVEKIIGTKADIYIKSINEVIQKATEEKEIPIEEETPIKEFKDLVDKTTEEFNEYYIKLIKHFGPFVVSILLFLLIFSIIRKKKRKRRKKKA